MRRSVLLISLVIGLALLAGGTAWAKSKTKEKLQLSEQATVTVDQAIKSATERVPGKVIEAELEKKHDKGVWEVEIATADNKIMEVHVDSMSGAIIDVEEEGSHKGKKK
ncbi:MAG TPA: PepSY domain-containing protein [Nitrospira sp.]|nr:PepSY domain-containing protein [Nitrospira sp.]